MLLTFFQKILLIKIVEIVGTVPKSMIHDNESHSKNIGYYFQKCTFGLLDRTLRVVRNKNPTFFAAYSTADNSPRSRPFSVRRSVRCSKSRQSVFFER